MQVVEQGGANREPQRQDHPSGAGSHDQQNSSSRGIGHKDKGWMDSWARRCGWRIGNPAGLLSLETFRMRGRFVYRGKLLPAFSVGLGSN